MYFSNDQLYEPLMLQNTSLSPETKVYWRKNTFPSTENINEIVFFCNLYRKFIFSKDIQYQGPNSKRKYVRWKGNFSAEKYLSRWTVYSQLKRYLFSWKVPFLLKSIFSASILSFRNRSLFKWVYLNCYKKMALYKTLYFLSLFKKSFS